MLAAGLVAGSVIARMRNPRLAMLVAAGALVWRSMKPRHRPAPVTTLPEGPRDVRPLLDVIDADPEEEVLAAAEKDKVVQEPHRVFEEKRGVPEPAPPPAVAAQEMEVLTQPVAALEEPWIPAPPAMSAIEEDSQAHAAPSIRCDAWILGLEPLPVVEEMPGPFEFHSAPLVREHKPSVAEGAPLPDMIEIAVEPAPAGLQMSMAPVPVEAGAHVVNEGPVEPALPPAAPALVVEPPLAALVAEDPAAPLVEELPASVPAPVLVDHAAPLVAATLPVTAPLTRTVPQPLVPLISPDATMMEFFGRLLDPALFPHTDKPAAEIVADVPPAVEAQPPELKEVLPAPEPAAFVAAGPPMAAPPAPPVPAITLPVSVCVYPPVAASPPPPLIPVAAHATPAPVHAAPSQPVLVPPPVPVFEAPPPPAVVVASEAPPPEPANASVPVKEPLSPAEWVKFELNHPPAEPQAPLTLRPMPRVAVTGGAGEPAPVAKRAPVFGKPLPSSGNASQGEAEPPASGEGARRVVPHAPASAGEPGDPQKSWLKWWK